MNKIAAALAAILPAFAGAEIVDFTVKSTQPYGDFAAGRFVKVEAEARGELSPDEPIPGIAMAPRNGQGRVEYRTPVTLVMPEAPAPGNGTVIVDVPNRGRPIAIALYNSPRHRPVLVGSLDQGTGFLQDRGFSVAVVQWELGEGPTFPTFLNQGQRLYVEGIGFAAVRDMGVFLRSSQKANPLAGRVERVMAVGYSQTARFVKTLQHNGFNQVKGQRVFDGLHVINAAAGVIPLLNAGPGPGSVAAVTPGHANPEFRGVHERPFTWGEAIRSAIGRYEKLPRVIVNNTYNDYLGGRASLVRTGDEGTDDRVLPDEVRLYDVSGAAHSSGRTPNAECREGPGQVDWMPALRAQLVVLDEWMRGRAPPASRMFDVEARPNDAEVFQAPQYLGAKAVVQVPKRDADGNAMSGVVLPDVAVPTGSHGFMNAPLRNMACRQAGAFRPFAKTAAERRAANDERLSLEERYPGGINEYVTRVRVVARALVADRLLLPEDAAAIVHDAAESPLFTPTKPRSRGATAAPASER